MSSTLAQGIPEATPVTRLHPQSNQVVVLVDVWMPAVREHIDGRAVKKTLSIPKWLNDMAEREKVNFSHVLQSALKSYLGVNQR